jgi:hypothetical protein
MDRNAYQRKLIFSVGYFLASVLLLTMVTYAWFTLTNTNTAALVATASGVEAEYQFYIYQDNNFDGNPVDPVLTGNVCIDPDSLDCYLFIPNPTSAYLVPRDMAPGDRISFALKITNIGTTDGELSLIFGDVQSYGFELAVNKLQTAYVYGVSKISYVNNEIESPDIKENEGIEYYVQHFVFNQSENYRLVRFVPVSPRDTINNVVIVYFDFYFDPGIKGFDPMGEPLANSNIFRNQMFTIGTIYMTLFDESLG